MASNSNIISIKILGDATQAKKELDGAGAAVEQAESRFSRAGKAVNALTVPAAAVAAGLVAVGVKAFNSASALEQATGGMDAVFGAHAAGMKSLADGAAQNVGLAKSEYASLATLVGSQLKNMGTSMEELGPQTNKLIGLGADLAARYGGTTKEAVEALSSALKGETDPIERYGASVKEADVKAQMAAMGLNNLSGEAEKQGRAQALMALLTAQTTPALGAFAEEANTAAGQQQRANASWENAKAALGTALLPIVSAAAMKLAEFAGVIERNSAVIIPVVGVIGALAAGILVAKGVMIAVTAVQWAWNVAMTANPIGIIIIAVAAVIAIIVLLIANWDTVKKVTLDVWRASVDAVRSAMDWIGSVAGKIGQWFSDGWNAAVAGFRKFCDDIIGGIKNLFDWFAGIPQRIANAFSGAAPQWLKDAAGFLGFSAPAEGGQVVPTGRAVFAAGGPSSAYAVFSSSSGATMTHRFEVDLRTDSVEPPDPALIGEKLWEYIGQHLRSAGLTPLGGA